MKSDVSNISNSMKVSEVKLPEFIKISFRGNKAGNGNIIEPGELVGDICDKSFLDGKIVESMDMEPLSADLDDAELVSENISEIMYSESLYQIKIVNLNDNISLFEIVY